MTVFDEGAFAMIINHKVNEAFRLFLEEGGIRGVFVVQYNDRNLEQDRQIIFHEIISGGRVEVDFIQLLSCTKNCECELCSLVLRN